MSDDIVQGLRFGQLTEKRANQAADRIEELEAVIDTVEKHHPGLIGSLMNEPAETVWYGDSEAEVARRG